MCEHGDIRVIAPRARRLPEVPAFPCPGFCFAPCKKQGMAELREQSPGKLKRG